jgi:hypothetical protein
MKSTPWRLTTGVQRRQQRRAGADRHLDQNTGIDEGRVEFFDLDIGDHTAIVDLWIDLCEPSRCFLAARGKTDFRAGLEF